MEVFSGLLAGLSVGIYCLGACLPIFIPILLSKKRTVRSSFFLTLEFSFGRLLGYLFFGFLAGFLGKEIQGNFLHWLAGLSTFLLGLVMILYSFNLWHKKITVCFLRFPKIIKAPSLLGFLTGASPCPPFLASLSYVFNLRDILRSVFYFGFFFLGTSFYIVPLAILGVFSHQNFFQKIAQVSGVLVGFYFTLFGLKMLV